MTFVSIVTILSRRRPERCAPNCSVRTTEQYRVNSAQFRLSDSGGDLSVSYGNYSEARGNVGQRGIYDHDWRTTLNGDWKTGS